MCTKSFVGWGFAPDPTGGAYSAPPDPLAALRGPTSKGKGEGKGGDRKDKTVINFGQNPRPETVFIGTFVLVYDPSANLAV